MLEPDFSKNSLMLLKGDEVIYSSTKSGLRPLIECADKYKGKLTDCTLYDKVVGLAAARLIAYSNIISLVYTQVSSEPAKALLEKSKIELKSESVSKNILNKERTSLCPMEAKALKVDDNESFFLQLKKIFGY